MLVLALNMYYLLPEGHFLTDYTFSAPTVGLDTKKLFAWALLHFLQGLEENTKSGAEAGNQSKRAAHPLTDTGSRARPGRAAFYSFPCPWVSSWCYLRSSNQDIHRHPHTFWVFLMHKLHLRPRGPSAISNDPASTGCRNVTRETLGLNLPCVCFPH